MIRTSSSPTLHELSVGAREMPRRSNLGRRHFTAGSAIGRQAILAPWAIYYACAEAESRNFGHLDLEFQAPDMEFGTDRLSPVFPTPPTGRQPKPTGPAGRFVPPDCLNLPVYYWETACCAPLRGRHAHLSTCTSGVQLPTACQPHGPPANRADRSDTTRTSSGPSLMQFSRQLPVSCWSASSYLP